MTQQSLVLVEPSAVYQKEYLEMITEWQATGERMVPFILRFDHKDFPMMLHQIRQLREEPEPGQHKIKSSSFWLLDPKGKILGAVNIRHALDEKLLRSGGHIGYGIRPSARHQGYATELLQLALSKASALGITKALLVCDKDNIGSAKTIQKNGGILESEEVDDQGIVIQRYWITVGVDPVDSSNK